jgi:hypothetical protein
LSPSYCTKVTRDKTFCWQMWDLWQPRGFSPSSWITWSSVQAFISVSVFPLLLHCVSLCLSASFSLVNYSNSGSAFVPAALGLPGLLAAPGIPQKSFGSGTNLSTQYFSWLKNGYMKPPVLLRRHPAEPRSFPSLHEEACGPGMRGEPDRVWKMTEMLGPRECH